MSDDLQRLLLDGSSSSLCCKIFELHPSHGKNMVSLLEDCQENIHSLAPFVNALLDHKNTFKVAKALLPKLQTTVRSWAMSLTDEKMYLQELFLHSLRTNILGMYCTVA